MYELRIVRERKQGYGAVRRIRDAAQVYAAFKEDFTQAAGTPLGVPISH